VRDKSRRRSVGRGVPLLQARDPARRINDLTLASIPLRSSDNSNSDNSNSNINSSDHDWQQREQRRAGSTRQQQQRGANPASPGHPTQGAVAGPLKSPGLPAGQPGAETAAAPGWGPRTPGTGAPLPWQQRQRQAQGPSCQGAGAGAPRGKPCGRAEGGSEVGFGKGGGNGSVAGAGNRTKARAGSGSGSALGEGVSPVRDVMHSKPSPGWALPARCHGPRGAQRIPDPPQRLRPTSPVCHSLTPAPSDLAKELSSRGSSAALNPAAHPHYPQPHQVQGASPSRLGAPRPILRSASGVPTWQADGCGSPGGSAGPHSPRRGAGAGAGAGPEGVDGPRSDR